MIEAHTGLELRLRGRCHSVSRVAEFVGDKRRLKLSVLGKLQAETEKELEKCDFVVYFVPYRRVHGGPRLDARRMRYFAWNVTDMRDSHAVILFYGSACSHMAAQHTGGLWAVINPILLQAKRQRATKPSDDIPDDEAGGSLPDTAATLSSSESTSSGARRTFVVMGQEQLLLIGRLSGFSQCLAKDRRGNMCGNPVDTHNPELQRNILPQGAAFCAFHKVAQYREEKLQLRQLRALEADGIYYSANCPLPEPEEPQKIKDSRAAATSLLDDQGSANLMKTGAQAAAPQQTHQSTARGDQTDNNKKCDDIEKRIICAADTTDTMIAATDADDESSDAKRFASLMQRRQVKARMRGLSLSSMTTTATQHNAIKIQGDDTGGDKHGKPDKYDTAVVKGDNTAALQWPSYCRPHVRSICEELLEIGTRATSDTTNESQFSSWDVLKRQVAKVRDADMTHDEVVAAQRVVGATVSRIKHSAAVSCEVNAGLLLMERKWRKILLNNNSSTSTTTPITRVKI